MNTVELIRARLASDRAPEALVHTFLDNVRRVAAGETGLLSEAALEPVPELPSLEGLSGCTEAGHRALAHALVLKLNGGLGTSMGLDKAKSLLPVKDGACFLDLIARQVIDLRRRFNAGLPLLLMNSYRTEADTLEVLARHPGLQDGQRGLPFSFLQHRVPKLLAASFLPADWPADPELTWCPPGHGDLYTALLATGLLDRLLAGGFHYAFVSNADNLGALLDPALLGYMAEKQLPFLMEVTHRTPADRKGGHLARLRGGGLVLRESAQCPPAESAAFQDIERHRFFNTNNLWIDLRALRALANRTGGGPALPVMVNRKTLDPRDARSPTVLQLETAMGAALSVFAGSGAVCVPRTRFSPVKTTDDLLALWSDAFVLAENGSLNLHPSRNGVPPLVSLDAKHYKLWPDFATHFPAGAPSLLACASFTVKGDVVFGPGVVVRSTTDVRHSIATSARVEHRILEGTLEL